jgi:hypothetical protein
MVAISQLEMSRLLDELKECSSHLGSINRRVTKYLDRMESGSASGWTPGELLGQFKIDGPPEMICAWCMAEINYRGGGRYHECEHALLCEACAPCDECSFEEEEK